MATVDVVGRPLDELRANGFTQIEIDLREVTFMDSTGLRLLVGWRRRALTVGFDLQIVLDPDWPVARVVELTRLQAVLLSSPVARGLARCVSVDPILPKQAVATELVEAAGAEARDAGGKRAAISNALVALFKEFYGKGPVAAKTYFNDDWVFTVLDGGLTRNEETLVQAGEDALVRQVRLRFQEVVTETISGAVADITGRRVLNYHSQLLFDPIRCVEMFLLAPLPDGQDA